MATSYFIYTEMKQNGVWHCINSRMKDVKTGKDFLTMTYESGSRTYFGETADKIQELGISLAYDGLSPELQGKFHSGKDIGMNMTAIDYNTFLSVIPNGKLHEFQGYVRKSTIAQFELGEIEDIFEWCDYEEYEKMSDKKKQFYQYYEWNDPAGWYSHFLEIREHVHWQLAEWDSVNYGEEYEKLRLVLFIF